jgi:hypothetical protein
MKEIEQADEPAWMAYTMSQLAMAMANGILFDSKDVINGASCILERLDELEWNRQQPPDPYPNRVRDEALQFMERVHQRIQNWFEQHKPIQCAYVEVEGEIVAYSDDLFYWDCDGQYHRSPEPTEDIEVSRGEKPKFKVQIPSVNGWADLKVATDEGSYEVELFDSHAAALADVRDELEPDEFRIVPSHTPADDDLY